MHGIKLFTVLKQFICGITGHRYMSKKNLKWVGKGKKRKPQITYTSNCILCGKLHDDCK